MSDKDENREENAVVAIIIGFAVVLAIAVSFWAAFGAISLSGKPATASAAATVGTAGGAIAGGTSAGGALAGGATAAGATAGAADAATTAASAASATNGAAATTDTGATGTASAGTTAAADTSAGSASGGSASGSDASAGTASAGSSASAGTAAAGAPDGAAANAIAGPVKLYFDTGSNALPATTAADLAPIVEAIKAGRADRAVVSGFHDKTGSVGVNAEISKARALAVAGALRDAGLTDAQIDLRKPQETTGDGSNREARRVEVTAEKG